MKTKKWLLKNVLKHNGLILYKTKIQILFVLFVHLWTFLRTSQNLVNILFLSFFLFTDDNNNN